MSEWKGIEEEAREWLVGVGYGEGRVIYSSEGVEHPTRDSLAALIRRAVAHGVRRALPLSPNAAHTTALSKIADAIERGDADV